MEINLGNPPRHGRIREVPPRARKQIVRDFANSPYWVHRPLDLLLARVALGEHADSVRAADAIRQAPGFRNPEQQSVLYRLACIYSLSAAAVEEVRRPNPINDEEKKLQADYRDKALTALEQSHVHGNRDFQNTRLDADLISIRNDPRFAKVLELEKKQKE